MAGKGDKPRPISNRKKFTENWNDIFGPYVPPSQRTFLSSEFRPGGRLAKKSLKKKLDS